MSRKHLIIIFLIGAGLAIGLNYVSGCSSLGPTEEVSTTTTLASASSTTAATTTTIYTPPLSVISVIPTNGGTAVYSGYSSATNISATFNQGVDINSISSSSFILSSPEGSIPGTVSYDETSNTLTFHSSHISAHYGYLGKTYDLDLSTAYTATLSPNLKDYLGRTLGTPNSWNFTSMGQMQPPAISPPSGSFEAGTIVTVEIQSIPGATIYYTVDGNVPGGIYSGAFQITIDKTRSILSYAAKSDEAESDLVTIIYTVKP